MTHESFVASLDFLVRLVPQRMPDSGPGVVKSGWTMLHVREVKVPLSIVGTEVGALITASTVKMHR